MTNRTDNFTRADVTGGMGTPSDGGSQWAAPTGNFGIISNTAYKFQGAAHQTSTLESSVTAVDVQATITAVGSTNGGIVARASDDSNFILHYWNGTSNILYKQVATVYTQLGSTFTGTLAANDVLKLSCDSSDLLTCYQNGVSRISATDSALNTVTKHGLESFGEGTANSLRWDDFSITAITSDTLMAQACL